jgi:hypothetical protein
VLSSEALILEVMGSELDAARNFNALMRPVATTRFRPRWLLPLLGVTAAAAIFAAARALPPPEEGPIHAGSTPRTIAGGIFEASGLASVPGTRQLVFVDDNSPGEIFLLELTEGGTQAGEAVSITLPAHVTDMEGVTFDGGYFYVVGSQSKRAGFEGDGLARFRLDADGRRVAEVETLKGLKAWLAANVEELQGSELRRGDRVLNIEGLAWDPLRERLLLGLRAPLVGDSALVIPLRLVDRAGPLSYDNLRVEGSALRVFLGGAGIRALEYDERERAFWIITGSWVNRESRDFRLLYWDGESGAPDREIGTYSRRLKPEGIARAMIGERSVTVVVFDTGYYSLLD